MSNVLRKILFNSVVAVILLHAFVVHPHSDEMTETGHAKIHQNVHSILGLISITFHESDDESLDKLSVTQNHLAESTDTTYPYLLIAVITNQLVIDSLTPEKTQKWSLDKISSLFIVRLNGVRGPPLAIS